MLHRAIIWTVQIAPLTMHYIMQAYSHKSTNTYLTRNMSRSMTPSLQISLSRMRCLLLAHHSRPITSTVTLNMIYVRKKGGSINRTILDFTYLLHPQNHMTPLLTITTVALNRLSRNTAIMCWTL